MPPKNKGKKGGNKGGSSAAPPQSSKPAAVATEEAAVKEVEPPVVSPEAPAAAAPTDSSTASDVSAAAAASAVTSEASSNQAEGDKLDSTASAAEGGAQEAGDAASAEVEEAAGGKQGATLEDEQPLYPVPVTGPSGETFELQVSPSDTLMDLRQFLADAPETCFYTCYDVLLSVPEGTKYHLVDDVYVGDVTDISKGGCSLQLLTGYYDDRNVRFHVRRLKELMGLAGCHLSHASKLAIDGGVFESQDEEDASPAADSAAPTPADSAQEKEDKLKELAELDGMTSMEESTKILEEVLPPFLVEPACVKGIAFSTFNPVPGARRLAGDILYYDIVTLEGERLCVTANTRGFFVNKSNLDEDGELDPTPADPDYRSETLVGLLRQASAGFSKGLKEAMHKKGQLHPFENVVQPVAPAPWVARHPQQAHRRDPSRAEEHLGMPFGGEMTGMQRDWNEEFQSVRDFAKESLNDRLLRDRIMSKVNQDFLEAAVKGAKAVIGRCVPSINPADPERYHLYVHNNIFFSLAVDSDFPMMQLMREAELKEQAEKEGKEGTAKADAKKAEAEPKEGEAGAAGANGDAAAPNLLDAAEHTTFASANNDLKGVKALLEADVAGLYTLAATVIDFRGHRVYAQSMVPGLLHNNRQDTLIYGLADQGKRLVFNEKFHEKAQALGRLLHLSESVFTEGETEGEMKNVTLATSSETKGIRGADERQYMLDLVRTTPRDVNYNGPFSKFMVLRRELVEAFCKVEAMERAVAEHGEEAAQALSPSELPHIALNPNVFTDAKMALSPEKLQQEEELVRKAGSYLTDTAIPKLIADLEKLEATPLDGQTLSAIMHERGINIRYIGRITKQLEHLPHFHNIFVAEMVARTAKHVFKAVLRETYDQDVSGALAHLLNCFLGTHPPAPAAAATAEAPAKADAGAANGEPAPTSPPKERASSPAKKGKAGKKGKGGKKGAAAEEPPVPAAPAATPAPAAAPSPDPAAAAPADATPPELGYRRITPEMVWSDVREATRFKYSYVLPDDIQSKYRKLSVLRSLCISLGLVIAARPYDLDVPTPFTVEDIVDMQPVAKHAWPTCLDAVKNIAKAKEMLKEVGLPVEPCILGPPKMGGWFKLNEAKLTGAHALLVEAYNYLQNVSGNLNEDIGTCTRLMALVQFHGSNAESAMMQELRNLLACERMLGVDHPYTAISYANISVYYNSMGNVEMALKHCAHSLRLLTLQPGNEHPTTAAALVAAAMHFQEANKSGIALRALQESLNRSMKLLGKEHLHLSVCYHALALAFHQLNNYKLAFQHEKSALTILRKHLGDTDLRTIESGTWVKEFQKGEQLAIMKKASANINPETLKSLQQNTEVMKALRAAMERGGGLPGAGAPGGGNGRGAAAGGGNGKVPGVRREATPGLRARGVDERAARATEEARKKAMAKGLSVRSGGQSPGSGAAAPNALDQLRSLISQGGPAGKPSTPDASGSGKPPLKPEGLGIGATAPSAGVAAVVGGAPSPRGEGAPRNGWTGGSGSPSTSGQSVEANGVVEGVTPADGAAAPAAAAPLGLGLGLGDTEPKKKKKGKKGGADK